MSENQSVLGLGGSPNRAGRTNELVSAALEGARSDCSKMVPSCLNPIMFHNQ